MNLFMMCVALNRNALKDIPEGYKIRNPRPGELDIWKEMPFDGIETANELIYMTEWYERVYTPKQFFEKCLFAVEIETDTPVGTCFAWKAYGELTTIHWFKAVKKYENRGIGRALLSEVMRNIPTNDYPVYLHTQPELYRAIKLYSDFGFALMRGTADKRGNDLDLCLSYLKEHMPPAVFESLRFEDSPPDFIKTVSGREYPEF